VTDGEERHSLHERLVERLGERRGEALYTFACCLFALALSGLAAYVARQPLLFPSLGPTAFLFFEQPMAEASSPRNTLIGHSVAIGAGAFALAVFGLFGEPSVLVENVGLARVGAGALSGAHGRRLVALEGVSPTDRRDDPYRQPRLPADAARDGRADGGCGHSHRRRLARQSCLRDPRPAMVGRGQLGSPWKNTS
jgi:hypothetical protein